LRRLATQPEESAKKGAQGRQTAYNQSETI
jgi:hypothetical protein